MTQMKRFNRRDAARQATQMQAFALPLLTPRVTPNRGGVRADDGKYASAGRDRMLNEGKGHAN